MTLKNIGTHTVHLSRLACQEPVVAFEREEPHSSSGWWPISQVSNPSCAPSKYENLRLRPGETTTYSTRLLSAKRERGPRPPTAPGSYAIRAGWQLVGCTEAHEGTDCLAPLQVLKPNPWGTPLTGDIEYQSSVQVMSEPIEVSSPTLPDLGPLQLGFELSTLPESQAALARKRLSAPCVTESAPDLAFDLTGRTAASMDCTVFHYALRNLGSRPVRNGRYTCSDYSIIPEYRTDEGTWQHLEPRLTACTANIYFGTPILPGKTAEGDFALRTLAPHFDTSPLHPAGTYQLRIQFHPSACPASPDGSFCLQRSSTLPAMTSNVVVIHAGAYRLTGP